MDINRHELACLVCYRVAGACTTVNSMYTKLPVQLFQQKKIRSSIQPQEKRLQLNQMSCNFHQQQKRTEQEKGRLIKKDKNCKKCFTHIDDVCLLYRDNCTALFSKEYKLHDSIFANLKTEKSGLTSPPCTKTDVKK